MNRHKIREVAMTSLYTHLLLNKDIRKCVFDAMHGENAIDGYLYNLTINTVENEYTYIRLINSLLRDDWTFNRLSVLEQAILLMGCQEIKTTDTPKQIIINEAVELCKKYCDDDSYKLINGVLDKI